MWSLTKIHTLGIFQSKNEKDKKKKENQPASYSLVEVDNKVFFLRIEGVMFEVRPQVISPPESTTLSTSIESCKKPHAKMYFKKINYRATWAVFNGI